MLQRDQRDTSNAHPLRIAMLGGTGFVGRALAGRLAHDGHRLTIATRRAARHQWAHDEPNIELREGDPRDRGFLTDLVSGCDAVANLIGVAHGAGESTGAYREVHGRLPRTLGRVCREAGVPRVLHLSALGAQSGGAPSRYLRTKGEGDDALQVELGTEVAWTVLRPGPIFGPDDRFTVPILRTLQRVPLPLSVPDADTRLAPVFIGDVVAACVTSLTRTDVHGSRYELAGPRIYTLAEVIETVSEISGWRRRIWRLPAGLSASWPTGLSSRQLCLPVDHDLVPRTDGRQRLDIRDLGIEPSAMEDVLPGYLPRRYPQAA